MGLFGKKAPAPLPYDPDRQQPAVRRSICTGEMTVGFIDLQTGKFHELMRVDASGLEDIKRRCRVENIKTIY